MVCRMFIDKYKYCLENNILLDLNEIKFKDKFLKTKGFLGIKCIYGYRICYKNVFCK